MFLIDGVYFHVMIIFINCRSGEIMRIQGNPYFRFMPTKKQIDLLKFMSQRHYDDVCRQASFIAFTSTNGFLIKWEFTASLYHENELFEVTASNSEIQICLKIMEDAYLHHFNENDMKIIKEMENTFYQAFNKANELRIQWQFTLES